MARPQKQTVDYFPHRCKPGKTMFILETRYSDKGYTFWFKLLELLGSTESHSYYFDKEDNCEYLQAYTRTTKEQATEILDLLANLDAIDKELWINNHIIWSDNFVDGIKDAYRNRIVVIPNKPVSDVRNTTVKEVSDVRNPQSIVKKSIIKNITSQFFDLFWKEYPKKAAKKDAIKAFNTAIKERSNGYTEESFTEMLITALRKVKVSDKWLKEDGKFINNPATWLNGKRWEDEIAIQQDVSTQYVKGDNYYAKFKEEEQE